MTDKITKIKEFKKKVECFLELRESLGFQTHKETTSYEVLITYEDLLNILFTGELEVSDPDFKLFGDSDNIIYTFKLYEIVLVEEYAIGDNISRTFSFPGGEIFHLDRD